MKRLVVKLGFFLMTALVVSSLLYLALYLSPPTYSDQANEELVKTKTLLILKNGTELIRLGEFQEGFRFKRIDIKDAYIEILLKDGVVFVYYNGTTQFKSYNVSQNGK